MAEPVSSTVVVVVVVVIAVGVGLFLLFKTYTMLSISPGSMNLRLYGQAPLTATLKRKGWAFGSYTDTGGTLSFTTTGAAAVSPGGVTTTAASATATVTVTGAAPGTGTVTVVGTTTEGGKVGASIGVTVARD
jgi:hypothetical protein